MSDLAMNCPVLVINPNLGAEQSQQDIHLESLVAWLRSQKLTVRYLDPAFHHWDTSEFYENISQAQASLQYWHIQSRTGFLTFRQWASNHPTSSHVYLGGSFALMNSEAILQAVPWVDGIIFHEAEATLLELSKNSVEERKLCSGVMRRVNGSLTTNPARDMMPITHFPRAITDSYHLERCEKGQSVLFSRGCNSNCSYCGLQVPYHMAMPGKTRFWQSRSPEQIIDELKYFHQEKGVNVFHFNSYVFFGYDQEGTEVIRRVSKGILENRLEIKFSFVTHPHHLYRNKHLLPLLKEAGLDYITIGIDSGLSRARDMYALEFDQRDILLALESLHRAQIRFYSSFIFYDPYLTLSEIGENFEFFDQIAPYYTHMDLPFSWFVDRQFINSIFHLRQGMPIYQKLLDDGLTLPVNPLESGPILGFQHEATGRFFKTHQLINKQLLYRIRPFFYANRVVAEIPEFSQLYLALFKQCLAHFQADGKADPQLVYTRLSKWLMDRLSPHLETIMNLLDLEEVQRNKLRTLVVEGQASTPV